MPYQQLTQEQRYHIQVLREEDNSISEIARRMKRSKSTISRELARNSKDGIYDGSKAQKYTTERRSNAKKRTVWTRLLKSQVEALLDQWSCEQISGRLAFEMSKKVVSHETIYQYVYRDMRSGGLLYKKLPRKGKCHKYDRSGGENRGKFTNRKSIHDRPEAANLRSESGHFEGDTIHGQRGSLATFNDRRHRFLIIEKIPNRTAASLNQVIKNRLSGLDIKTLTLDNGKEFSGHEEYGMDVYFADPYSSYQRGSNENLNGLIRRVYPKGTHFDDVSEEAIRELEMKINLLPKKCLGWKTPYESYYSVSVALISLTWATTLK